MSEIYTALAFVLVFEGLAYAVAPDFMKKMMREIMDVPSDVLRNMGLFVAVIGIIFVWISRM